MAELVVVQAAAEQQVLRQQTRLLTAVTAEQAQAVKAVEAVVQVVGLQEPVEPVEQVVNPLLVEEAVEHRVTDLIQAQEGLEVRALFASIHGR